MALDASGNLYIADSGNHRIRKVNTSGIISTIAGTVTSSFSGDGGLAINAEMNLPSDVKLDASGNIYISDSGNRRIRKVDLSNIIKTIAGTGSSGFTGDGGPATTAQIGDPVSIKLDVSGNIFICDDWNSVVRKINNLGIISTLTGNGVAGYSGDGGPAYLAQVYDPSGIEIDPSGNIYISDQLNYRIRIICVSSCALGIDENKSSFNLDIFPNPATNFLNIRDEQNELDIGTIEITNTLGQCVLMQPFPEQIDVSSLERGCYFIKVVSNEKTYYSKFLKE